MPEELPQDEKPETEVQTTKNIKGTVTFGKEGFNNPTPMLVTWIFRTEFVLNKCVGIWMASQDTLSLGELKTFVLWVTIIDAGVWGFGKFFGIKKEDLDK